MGGSTRSYSPEGSARTRSRCERAWALRAAFLGIEVDGPANDSGARDRVISASESAVAVLVLSAREDIELAAQVRASLAPA
jgi:acetate kinase